MISICSIGKIRLYHLCHSVKCEMETTDMEMESYYMQALMEMDVGIAQPTDGIIVKGYRFQNHPGTKYYRSITARREKPFYDMQRSASIRARRMSRPQSTWKVSEKY